MLPRIIKFYFTEKYNINLLFSNNQTGTIDLSPFLEKGDFRILKEEKLFKKAVLVDGVLTWFGNLDISPDTLYLLSKKDESSQT
jgi:hypothetical protein